MKMNKTLTSIVLAGALALGGCSGKVDDSRYEFNGKLGNESVEFKTISTGWGTYFKATNSLIVKKEDGKVMTYVDRGNDLQLDEVRIGDEVYRNDAVGEEAIKLAQGQFDSYLTKILEYKQQKAIEAVK